jgi:hypothetical protein
LKEWFDSVAQRMKDEAKGMRSIDADEELDADSSWTDPDVAGLRG